MIACHVRSTVFGICMESEYEIHIGVVKIVICIQVRVTRGAMDVTDLVLMTEKHALITLLLTEWGVVAVTIIGQALTAPSIQANETLSAMTASVLALQIVHIESTMLRRAILECVNVVLFGLAMIVLHILVNEMISVQNVLGLILVNVQLAWSMLISTST